MEWIKITAKTLPEAIDLAIDNLGVDESEVEIVVLKEPKTGLLGSARGVARVEARVKPPDLEPSTGRGRDRAGAPGTVTPPNASPPAERTQRNRVFLSYRRTDTGPTAGRLYDRLVQELGEDRIFHDVDNVPLGEDFTQVVKDTIDLSAVMIVVIGRSWTGSGDDERSPLFNKADYVRMEIEQGLQDGLAVIPLLVEGAEIPDPDLLPESIRPLAYRNAATMYHATWKRDCDALVEGIRTILAEPRRN